MEQSIRPATISKRFTINFNISFFIGLFLKKIRTLVYKDNIYPIAKPKGIPKIIPTMVQINLFLFIVFYF
jgi:hypothetical protein